MTFQSRGARSVLAAVAALSFLSGCSDISDSDFTAQGEQPAPEIAARAEEADENPHLTQPFEQPESLAIRAQGTWQPPGVPMIASANQAGTTANGYSYWPSLSADGKYVVFSSRATNLDSTVPGNSYQIFRKNLETGEVELVSRPNGTSGYGSSSSYYAEASASGDAVAFYSYSSNLIPGISGSQLYLRDMTTDSNTLISRSTIGTAGNSSSYSYDFGGDDYVAFYSYASNLVAGDTNSRSDVFVWERPSENIERVNVSSTGAQADGYSYYGSVSEDGETVAFRSSATNLAAGGTGSYGVFIRNQAQNTTTRLNTGSNYAYNIVLSDDGTKAAYSIYNYNLGRYELHSYDVVSGSSALISSDAYPSYFELSKDGRYLAYCSYDQGGADNDGRTDVYIYDLDTFTNVMVSDTPSTSYCYRPDISEDGSTVVWDQGGQVYVAANPNYEAPASWEPPTTPLVISTSVNGDVSNAGWNGVSNPRISDDGQFVSFESRATNLHPEGNSSTTKVYRKNVATDAIDIVSRENGTDQVAEAYGYTAISSDGSKVVFTSRENDLTSTITPGGNWYTTYIRDFDTGVTSLLGYKVNPSDFGDSKVAVWSSEQLANDYEAYPYDTFFFDLATGTFEWVSQAPDFDTSASSTTHVMSDDGRYSLFKSSAGTGGLFYRDNQTGQVTQITSDLYYQEFDISGDGLTVSYVLNSTKQLYVDKMNDSQPARLVVPTQARAPHLSDDGRYLLYYDSNMPVGANTGSGSRAYVYDWNTTQALGIDPDARYSGHMGLSGDGRTVVFLKTIGSSSSQLWVQRNPHL